MRGRGLMLALAVGCGLPFVLTACGTTGPPDFVLSLASDQPAVVTIAPGGTASISFQVSAFKGSHGSITLNVSGLPTGVGIAPGSATVGIGSVQQFSLAAATNAPATTAPVTLTATGVSGNPLVASSISHTQTVTLAVATHP